MASPNDLLLEESIDSIDALLFTGDHFDEDNEAIDEMILKLDSWKSALNDKRPVSKDGCKNCKSVTDCATYDLNVENKPDFNIKCTVWEKG